ncbi:hypothetical protein HDU99_000874 [Rhizoclosmatium hyalinum]|nr:hypothetical protein HDU99_000874 [Rhizoclosmatium hyalinum]
MQFRFGILALVVVVVLLTLATPEVAAIRPGTGAKAGGSKGVAGQVPVLNNAKEADSFELGNDDYEGDYEGDDEADLAALLQEEAEAAAQHSRGVLDVVGGWLKGAIKWAEEHKYLVLSVFAVLLSANVAFVMFVMGYLLKEEHYVVRAVKLAHSDCPKVWRALTDFDSYPLWRKSVSRVNYNPKKKDDLLGRDFVVNGKSYTITEANQNLSLVFATNPEYTPEEYALPMVIKGAPVPENINEQHKKEYKQKVEKLKEEGIDATAHIPKHRGKNILDLPAPPFFLPADIPWATEQWTFELEPSKDKKGTLLYLTYRGTYRSRPYRFFVSLFGFDSAVEAYLGDLSAFLGESTPTVKPVLGRLPPLE